MEAIMDNFVRIIPSRFSFFEIGVETDTIGSVP
jgi:hypothetical protein